MVRRIAVLGVCVFVGLVGCTDHHRTSTASQKIQYRFVCPTFAPLRAAGKVEGTIEARGSGLILRTRGGATYHVKTGAPVFLIGGPAPIATDAKTRACDTTHRQALSTLQWGGFLEAGIANDQVVWAIAQIP